MMKDGDKMLKRTAPLIVLLTMTFSLCLNSYADIKTDIKINNNTYVMTYVFNGTLTIYRNNINKTNNNIMSIAPDFLSVDSKGELITHKLTHTFIEAMHEKGIKVMPYLTNDWDKASGIAAMNNADKLANQIKAVVDEYNLDGVNVDIENVSDQYRTQYTYFVKRMNELMPKKIIAVAVAANPYGWTQGWHGCYDYKALSENCDYLMIMGYDESYYGSEPGPVASAAFTEKSIQYALKYTTADKLVLGIPFYGRYWKKDAAGDYKGGGGISGIDIENLMKNYNTVKVYDNNTQSAKIVMNIKQTDNFPTIWGSTVLTAGEYIIWYDDLKAIKFKMELIDKYGLKGIGSWALGQESDAVWDLYSEWLNKVNLLDIDENWAKELILECVDLGWMVGRTKTAFEPDKPLTRAEAAAILVRICNLQNEAMEENFSDTRGHWAEKDIRICRKYNFLRGYEDGSYRPNNRITREEIAEICNRMFVYSGGIDYQSKSYDDVNNDAWSFEAINKLTENGILTGYPNNKFYPKRNVSRGEAAAIFIRSKGFGTRTNLLTYNGGYQNEVISVR